MSSWRIFHFPETESTNILARNGHPGDVFTAGFQTAGRGRLDHKWLSPPDTNLMMSAVVDVSDLDVSHAATLPLAVGLAVAEGVAALLPGAGGARKGICAAAGSLMLKWPNDVLAGGRKLAGILCERHGGNAIAGIGVNVRQRVFPKEIAGRAASTALLGSNAGVDEARDAVLLAMDDVLDAWRSGFKSIYPRIAAMDWLTGRNVAVRQTDGPSPVVSGLCGGILPDGSLLVGGQAVWAGEAHVEGAGECDPGFKRKEPIK